MPNIEELEKRVSKIETVSNYKFALQVIIVPVVLLIIGAVINSTLKETELKQQRYKLTSELIPLLLDTVDAKKTYMSYQLMRNMDEDFGATVKPLLINWKLESIIDHIKAGNFYKATKEIETAKGGLDIGNEISKIFKDSIIDGKSKNPRYLKAGISYGQQYAQEFTIQFGDTASSKTPGKEQLVNKDTVAALLAAVNIVESKQTKRMGDKVMASNIVTQKASAKSVKPLPKNNGEMIKKKRGWLFLGTFENDKWVTCYINNADKLKPADLEQSSFSIRSSSNIRTGKPTENAEFLPIVESLSSGAKVKIIKVEPWSTTGYFWAEVEY